MNYIEWIKTIGLAIQLLVKSEFSGDVTVQLQWKNDLPGGFTLGESQPALCVSFFTVADSLKLCDFYLIPWQNIYINTRLEEKSFSISSMFLQTVTEYAIIYRVNADFTDNRSELHNQITSRLEKLLEVEENSIVLLEEQGLSTPSGIQIIRQQEYNNYIEYEIALPGTKLSMPLDFGIAPPSKMIIYHLIPDFGPIKTQWLSPLKYERDTCLTQSDEKILKIINAALNALMESSSAGKDEVFRRTSQGVEEILDRNGCKTDFYVSHYTDFLKKILDYKDPVTTEWFYESPFADYQPKTTPDVLTDYMPLAYNAIKDLPAVELDNLNQLIEQYRKYRKLAKKKPGKWVDGNMILGANPREYEPTYEEILLCEVGNRIRTLHQNFSPKELQKQARCRVAFSNTIHYKGFSVTHIDVMGSGRFFYIDTIEEVSFKLY